MCIYKYIHIHTLLTRVYIYTQLTYSHIHIGTITISGGKGDHQTICVCVYIYIRTPNILVYMTFPNEIDDFHMAKTAVLYPNSEIVLPAVTHCAQVHLRS